MLLLALLVLNVCVSGKSGGGGLYDVWWLASSPSMSLSGCISITLEKEVEAL
jgi:hypothetical protein